MPTRSSSQPEPPTSGLFQETRPVRRLGWISGASGILAASLAIAFAAVFPFRTALEGGFIWDDHIYIVGVEDFRGLAPANLKWMFTNTLGHYIPLTWISFGIDYSLWEMNPRGYHLTNLVLHATNALLFFGLLLALLPRWQRTSEASRPGDPLPTNRAMLGGAFVGALFFALHPQRVESVAWITERRDLLSTLFALLSTMAYLRRDSDRARGGSGRRWYWLSWALFVCSLGSKVITVALPAVFLLLDLVLLQRRRFGRLMLEKLPYFVVGASFAVLALISQSHSGAIQDDYSLVDRLLQPGFRFLFHLWKMVVPIDLLPVYTRAQASSGLGAAIASLAVASISVFLFVRRKKLPAPALAWFSYALLISPMVGVVQYGWHFAADRNTYFACLPFAALLAGICQRLARSPRAAIAMAVALCVLFGWYAQTSGRLTRIWEDSYSFWGYVIKVDPDCPVAYRNRGLWRERDGDPQGAMQDYDDAIRLRPDYARAYFSRGNLRGMGGDIGGAVKDYSTAIQIDPDYASPYVNRSIAFQNSGRLPRALEDLNRALDLNPRSVDGLFNRSLVHQRMGNLEAAKGDLTLCLELAPADWAGRPAGENRLQQLQKRLRRNKRRDD